MQRKTTTVIRVCVCFSPLVRNKSSRIHAKFFFRPPACRNFIRQEREKRSTLIIIDRLFAEKTTQLEDHKMLYHIVVFDR